MGLFDKLRDAFGRSASQTGEEPEPEYRCLQCGAGYDRKHAVCSDCGSEFIAPTNPDDDAEEEMTE
ncbi:MAG: hypothetical protein ABEJ68_02455 [Halobacteriaceae archaeon]